ncbi:efflux RND transporter periplasmic adaptor subunit [Virgibacillus sp. LDC-1]|uniref:efflux RND transporter periplasmic adaptor subunit n=1 Tax=Virgibacillus sp. LDC-1 TaxID=3039856 RepID=UPI0024DE7B86|nr:efflux RND transporter periplasmic adaptor subunit [Virgibacillus sp. LDC-1]
MRKKKVIMFMVLFFIGLNVGLVMLDKDKKVDRITYVSEWNEVSLGDVYERIQVDGMLDYINEQHVYFDNQLGGFDQFLVEEGDMVNKGDPLYSYKATYYYETKASLEREAERLTGEMEAIEAAIGKMNAYQVSQTTMKFVSPEGNETIEIPQNQSEATLLKEQYILEKEKERDQKAAQLKSIQSQISELSSSGDTITVESPFRGKVTTVSDGLDNPIVTIQLPELLARGELTEKERMLVEESMSATVSMTEGKQQVEGAVQFVAEEPVSLEIKTRSMYPFHVALDKEADDIETLLPGYHASILITLQESLDTPVITEKSLFGKYVWKMTATGKLVKTPVQTGIEMKPSVEVTHGVEQGQWLAQAKKERFRNDASFITPLQIERIPWKQVRQLGDWKKSITIGLLSR